MVTTGCKHAIASGNMTLDWRKWKRHPPNKLMWNHWKTHWTAAFAKMRDLNQMTTGNSPSGANQAATEMEQAKQMMTSLDNLANASIKKIHHREPCRHQRRTHQGTTRHSTNARPDDHRRTHRDPIITPIITPGSGCPHPSHWINIKPAWDKVSYCWSHGHKI